MLRFIRYLREDFYSYCESKNYLVLKADKTKFRRTSEFYFYQMILGGQKFLQCKEFKKQNYTLDSLCYLPFAYEINRNKDSFLKPTRSFMPNFVLFLENFKTYRRIRKLIKQPRNFFLDSKNPLFYPVKIYLQRCLREV